MTKLFIAACLLTTVTAFAADKKETKADPKRDVAQQPGDTYTCRVAGNRQAAHNFVQSCSGVVASSDDGAVFACCPQGGLGGAGGGGR